MYIDIIKRLYMDEELKLDFTARWIQANPKLGAASADSLWNQSFTTIKNTLKDLCGPARIICEQSLKLVLLETAEQGLSLDPRKKEAYIQTMITESGRCLFEIMHGYNGLKKLIKRTGDVRFITTSVVARGDVFEWRGSLELPLFVEQPGTDRAIYCSIASIVFNDGKYFSVKLDCEELMDIENSDLQRCISVYGSDSYSLYRSAWRKRMFEIAAIRHLYRSYCFSDGCEDQTHQSHEKSITDADFLANLESELSQVVGQ